MQGTLVLAVLNVKSSYVRDVEESLEGEDDIPDTLQWWIGPESAWRIKTFALDHDIHVYSVGPGSTELVELAQENNAKHYGEVIACQHILAFKDCEDTKEVRRVFKKTGLSPRLEVATGRFAFWKPDDAKYRTQSQPKS
ncbi:MAG TPA: hypothetical protein VGY66_20015 [Gemmataceae bacterium]|jgi:hypothetical protein|nr:hypothetical protein [Gemmataceae bacterium]